MSDDLRAELDRLEEMALSSDWWGRAHAGFAEGAAKAFPTIAAELRRLWAVEAEMARLRFGANDLRLQVEALRERDDALAAECDRLRAFRDYALLLAELVRLGPDSPGGEAVADRMDASWRVMSAAMVEDAGKLAAAMNAAADVRAEIARLRAEVSALHAQLQKQAYVVPDGAQLVVPPHVTEVGYVMMRGGHVAVQEGTQP